MNTLNNALDRVISGGFYMIPIFLVSIIMLSLVIFRGITLCIILYELKSIFSKGLETLGPSCKWNMRANEYKQFRSGIEKVDFELREQLSKYLVGRLGSGSGILFCSALATLLGLLGTVNGMVTSFDAMHIYGVGNTKSMASGISQALITTQSGLLIGIVGVMLGKLLSRLTWRLEGKVLHFYSLLEEKILNRNAQ